MATVDLESRVRAVVARCLAREALALEQLAPGLGRRHFFRVHLRGDAPPSTLVARVDQPEDPARRPPGLPPEPPLEPLRSFLEAAGLPVPARYGGDEEAGIDLLEDGGSVALRDAAARGDALERRRLYEEVCDLVPQLQRLEAPAARIPAFGRRLDAAFFRYKAAFFERWSLPVALGRAPTAAEREVVQEAFGLVAEAAAAAPQRLSHRDLQGANVMVRSRGAGRRLMLIDLQGAFLAPPEYDLVCLLRDSYVELPAEEVRWQLERLRPALPDAPHPDEFAHRFDLLTLSRKGKDHALGFYHAELRDDPREIRHAARCARYLKAAAARLGGTDPRLARLADLVTRLPSGEEASAGRSCAP